VQPEQKSQAIDLSPQGADLAAIFLEHRPELLH
jgi:hypothetical protein